MAGILCWLETQNGKIRKLSREVIEAARQLADSANIPVVAVLIKDIDDIEAMNNSGIQTIYTVTGPDFTSYSADAYTQAIIESARQAQSDIVMIGASALGKDLAGRVAVRLNAALLSDIVEINASTPAPRALKPVYSGKLLGEFELTGKPLVLTIRPNVFPEPAATSIKPSVVPFSPDGFTIRSKVIKALDAAQNVLDLTEAQVIVSGGRGVGGPEGFQLLSKLADTCGAALGASRAAVDSGWIPYKHQVGQTGKVVSPVLYIACGISGAIQHFAGMGSSRFILAINTDPDAPIMKKADFAIVGDLYKVVPVLIEELTRIRNK